MKVVHGNNVVLDDLAVVLVTPASAASGTSPREDEKRSLRDFMPDHLNVAVVTTFRDLASLMVSEAKKQAMKRAKYAFQVGSIEIVVRNKKRKSGKVPQ